MKISKSTRSKGFTLVELVISAVAAIIMIMAAGSVMLHSRQDFLKTYAKGNSTIITDAYAVRSMFDRTVRKSSASATSITNNGQNAWFEYYNNSDSTYLDRYTSFYISDSDFVAESGTLDQDHNQTVVETRTICSNVASCVFRDNGASVSMILSLTDSTKTKTVVTTAFSHN